MDWAQWLPSVGAVGALALALAAWLRARPAMRLADLQGEAKLWERIVALETKAEEQDKRLLAERQQCDERIARVEERHDEAMAGVDAKIRILRHERNNLRQSINALFARLKRNPEEVAEAIEMAEAMLARGDETIAVEKGGPRGKARTGPT